MGIAVTATFSLQTDAMSCKLIACFTILLLIATGCAGVDHVMQHSSVASAINPIVEGESVSHAVRPVAFLEEDEGSVADSGEEIQTETKGDNKRKSPAESNPPELDSVTVEPLTPFESIEMPIDGINVQSYTLTDIESLALSRNPAIASAEATIGKAAGLRSQVGTRPNPTLAYFGQQIADRNTDQHGILLEQEFVRGNKLQLNRDVLAHTQRAQTAESETQRYRVLTDVRIRFFEAVAAQQQVNTIRAFADVARRGVEVAEDRREAEEGTLIETLQSRTLLSEVTLAAEQAEVAYQGAWQDLAAIAGLQASTPARLIAELNAPTATPDWDIAYTEIVSQSPELVAARAIVCEKQALLRRQRAQPISNVTGQLGVGYDDGTEHGMINVQLSAPVPVWNKNSGNVSAAYSDYVRATQEVQRIEQSIRSRLARSAQEFDSAMKAVRKYDDEIIPQAKQSLELSEEAYRAGELEFLQVLIVRRSFYESSIRLIRAKGNLAQAAAKVDGLLLIGGLESPTDYTDGDGIRGASFGGQ